MRVEMQLGRWAACALCAVIVEGSTGLSHAQSPSGRVDADALITSTVATSVESELQVGERTSREAHATGLAVTIDEERSAGCGPAVPEFGRSRSNTSATNLASGQSQVQLTLVAGVEATGGRRIACVACLSGICINPSPQETKASARARASAEVQFALRRDVDAARYVLRFQGSANNSGGRLRFLVTDSAGEDSDGDLALPTVRTVVLSATKPVVVRIDLVAKTESTGSCCAGAASGQATIGVSVARAPIISDPDTAAITAPTVPENIGLLTLRGRPHCPGTLVSARKVLTALSCVAAFPLEDLDFVIPEHGSARQLSAQPARVIGFVPSQDDSASAPRRLAAVHLASATAKAAHATSPTVTPRFGMRLYSITFDTETLAVKYVSVRVVSVLGDTLTVISGPAARCGTPGSPLVASLTPNAAPVAIVRESNRTGCVASRLDLFKPWVEKTQ